MNRMMIGAGLALALAMGATAAADAKPSKTDWKNVTPAGAAEDCVSITAIRNTRVRDDRTIDFYMSGRKVYRNTLPQSCPGLGSDRAFSYETSLSRLCSLDIITVLRASSPVPRGASCGLGKFQPVNGAPK